MRVKTFRGKTIGVNSDGNYTYGSLWSRPNGDCFIVFEIEENIHELQVDPESVAQYTGLKDVNNHYIWEGSAFMIDRKKYYVEWHDDMARFVLTTGYGYDSRNCMDLTCDTIFNMEQIKE